MAMKWRGPEAMKLINMEVGRRVDAGARFIRDKAKEKVSREQPVVIYGKTGKRSRKGLDPSKPGEPPKMVSGWFRMNIKKEFDKTRNEARVGFAGKESYPKHLEIGTRKMEPRPWLRPTLTENAPELRARFGIGVKV